MCCSSGQAAPKCAKVAYWLFWIKIKGEPAGTKRTLWPSFVPMRAGNKAPVGRCPTFGYGWRASLLTERGDSRSRKLSEQTVLLLHLSATQGRPLSFNKCSQLLDSSSKRYINILMQSLLSPLMHRLYIINCLAFSP